jgi:hypothetical protein
MTTTTTTAAQSRPRARTAPASSTLAASLKFKAFALVFAISFPVLYVICDLFNLPLFTYHPAMNRFEFWWGPARSGEGPAMYWYGWTATCLVGGTLLGLLATLLPESTVKKIPLFLVWLLPLLAVPCLVYSLMPFWTK